MLRLLNQLSMKTMPLSNLKRLLLRQLSFMRPLKEFVLLLAQSKPAKLKLTIRLPLLSLVIHNEKSKTRRMTGRLQLQEVQRISLLICLTAGRMSGKLFAMMFL
jgi:hypothetical protein